MRARGYVAVGGTVALLGLLWGGWRWGGAGPAGGPSDPPLAASAPGAPSAASAAEGTPPLPPQERAEGLGAPEAGPVRPERIREAGGLRQAWGAAPLWRVDELTEAQVAVVLALEPVLGPAGRGTSGCVEEWVRRRPVNVDALEVQLERLFVPEGRAVRLVGAQVRFASDEDPRLVACLERAHRGLAAVPWPEGEVVPGPFRLPYELKRWGLEEVPREGWFLRAHLDPQGAPDCIPPDGPAFQPDACAGPGACLPACCACPEGQGWVTVAGCFDGQCVPPSVACERAAPEVAAVCDPEGQP